jgi:hypothetical protein
MSEASHKVDYDNWVVIWHLISWFSMEMVFDKNLLFDGQSIRTEKDGIKEKNAKNLMSLFENQTLWVWVGTSG